MNQLLYSEKTTNPIKIIIIVLIILLIVAIGALFVLSNKLDGKIFSNVYVGDVKVGLSTKEDAQAALEEGLGSYDADGLNLVYGTHTKRITASDIEFTTTKTIPELVEDAYQYGRDGNVFSNMLTMVKSYFNDEKIEVSYKFNDDKLEAILDSMISGDEELAGEDYYVISGDSVFIYKGKEGIKIDIEQAKTYITTAFNNHVTTLTLPTKKQESKKVDVKKIYNEVYVAPVDAYVRSGEKFEIVEQVNGKHFNIENVEKVYASLPSNKYMEIVLEPLEPKIKTVDVEGQLFKTELASYSSRYDTTDTERTKNLITASNKCNNKIINPGETFSFGESIGHIDESNGFEKGNGYVNGRVEKVLGGGICQVSSSIYNAVLLSNLQIVERDSHSLAVDYVDPGFDAVYVEGGKDFKFKNDRSYPIKIKSSAENGMVKVSILGMKDADEPKVSLEYKVLETIQATTITENDSSLPEGKSVTVQKAINGYSVETYKILKNAKGEEISRVLLATNTYAPINEIVKVSGAEELTPTPTATITPTNSTVTNTPVVIKTKTKTPTKTTVKKPTQTSTPIPTNPPAPTKTSSRPEDPSIIIYDDEGNQQIPSGWDSPESPYGKGN